MDIKVGIENNGMHACKAKTQMLEQTRGVYEVGVYLMSERFEWRERLNKTLFRDSR